MATSLIVSFRYEIIRLARKVAKSQLSSLQSASATHRRSLAALKRDIATLERDIRHLRKAGLKASPSRGSGIAADSEGSFRFQAKGLKSHRQRVGLSAADYARILGVSSLTVYNWESGKSKPRRSQLSAIAALRAVGKREALARLESLGASNK